MHRIPDYLKSVYWWAYEHPNAVKFFEREWLVNLILFGHYKSLCRQVLSAFEDQLSRLISGDILQLACVYGELTPILQKRLSTDASLSVLDALPIQLKNLDSKLLPVPKVNLILGNSASLDMADESFDKTLMFFLLHEQPREVRMATLTECLRVTRAGGRIVVVDYHKPVNWHPLGPLIRQVFRKLEPFAQDLCEMDLRSQIENFHPVSAIHHSTYFGGLYQVLVIDK